jgi:small conductance mechanosensitive channel
LHTKTWSRAVLDIGVAYREDVDRVIAVLREIADGFREDDEWAALTVDTPEVLGVQDLGDSAVIIRVSAKTLPQQQWVVARELRRRIKNRFDQEEIEIPFPHMTFYWGERQMPALAAAPDRIGAEEMR